MKKLAKAIYYIAWVNLICTVLATIFSFSGGVVTALTTLVNGLLSTLFSFAFYALLDKIADLDRKIDKLLYERPTTVPAAKAPIANTAPVSNAIPVNATPVDNRPDRITCPKCGKSQRANRTVCFECGADLTQK